MLNRIRKNISSALVEKTKSSKGFTLVETLVAISILMLAVTGPLYFASESLKAATYAKDQITAFYLAQDAFEQIRKIRDDDANGVDGWLVHMIGIAGNEICNSTYGCVVDPFGNSLNLKPVKCVSACENIKLDKENGYYGYKSDWAETPFKRTITVTPMDGTDSSNTTEVKVTVEIKWMSGTVPREFTAYEFLRGTPTS